jgi:hypothetical protein
MTGTNEAFSRITIDALLKNQGWSVLNPNAVRYTYLLANKTKDDYLLCARYRQTLGVIAAKKMPSIPPRHSHQRPLGPKRPSIHCSLANSRARCLLCSSSRFHCLRTIGQGCKRTFSFSIRHCLSAQMACAAVYVSGHRTLVRSVVFVRSSLESFWYAHAYLTAHESRCSHHWSRR